MVQTGKMGREVGIYEKPLKDLQVSSMGGARPCGRQTEHGGSWGIPARARGGDRPEDHQHLETGAELRMVEVASEPESRPG